MPFQCNNSGFDIFFRVDKYQKPSMENDYIYWCECSFIFRFKDIIHYEGDHQEILLSSEIDTLAEGLTYLLENKFQNDEKLHFAEPDFVFKFHPCKEQGLDTQHHWIQDISLEWQIYFWDDDGLTGNFLTITMNRNEITALRDYLDECRMLLSDQSV